eukprot:TRINITY_DN1613_c0_g1_i1.p1 TRINITY_DN1613_c0_g1~~TRINITY_DN1613_c0_g1_i1.p1  ORF type:complete len:263 (-),score=47.03 TRINITY_DN1613_c0_g1_i1:85-873(-)
MKMMQSTLAVLTLMVLSWANAQEDCTPLPSNIFSWVSNQLRYAPPMFSGPSAYLAIRNLSYTDGDIANLRNKSLNHLEQYFGVPTNLSIFDPITQRVTIPGYGYLDLLYFGDCYRLQVALDPAWTLDRTSFSLVTAEYAYYPVTVAPYGGKYAQLLNYFGFPPTPLPGNFVAYGEYNIFRRVGTQNSLVTRVEFAAKYPGIYDLPFRGFEEYFLYEPTWGSGTGTLELITAFTTPQGVLSQFNSLWTFPAANELYQLYGIPR